MIKHKIGIVTAWAECGMGYLARNWIYTIEKNLNIFDYQIYSRAVKEFTPFRWQGDKVINGPESMEINHNHFWEWVDKFKPDTILFQDQNIYGPSNMQEETDKLKKMGIHLINYPDWILFDDVKKYKGLYHTNLAHIKRNFNWLKKEDCESPTYIPWGVILKNFLFIERNPKDKVTFYINLGTGTIRKGYTYIPNALNKLDGNWFHKLLNPPDYNYSFIATSIENSKHRINNNFIRKFNSNPNCELIFKTADNTKGGLFTLGDVYIYPTMMEGVGLTITESLASGMPVVTTNFPTMNEWFEDGHAGKLIDVNYLETNVMNMEKAHICSNHLAQILKEYIDNPSLIKEQSHNARKLVELKYNWDDRDIDLITLLKG